MHLINSLYFFIVFNFYSIIIAANIVEKPKIKVNYINSNNIVHHSKKMKIVYNKRDLVNYIDTIDIFINKVN